MAAMDAELNRDQHTLWQAPIRAAEVQPRFNLPLNADTMGDCTPSTRIYARVEYARVCSNMLRYAGVALQCTAAVYSISCTI